MAFHSSSTRDARTHSITIERRLGGRGSVKMQTAPKEESPLSTTQLLAEARHKLHQAFRFETEYRMWSARVERHQGAREILLQIVRELTQRIAALAASDPMRFPE